MFSSINAETRTIVECGLAPSTIVRASALCLKTSSYLHTLHRLCDLFACQISDFLYYDGDSLPGKI